MKTLLILLSVAFGEDKPVAAPEATPAVPAAVEEKPAEAVPAEAVPGVVEEDAPPTEEKPSETPEVKAPETPEEAVEDAGEAVSALQQGKWGLAAALLVGVLVFVWKRFKKA